MPGAWDIVFMADSHRIMELGGLCGVRHLFLSGSMAYCSIPYRVFTESLSKSHSTRKWVAFHGPAETH